MTFDPEFLSAYLDGELTETATREVEAALAEDVELQAELERLMAADHLAREDFDGMLTAPVPASLASAILAAPGPEDALEPAPANTPAPPPARRWLGAAAVVAALLMGGAVGYVAGTGLPGAPQVAAVPGWLEDIADYHRIYASQGDHLVEIPARKTDYIQTYLTKAVGADVRVPDLSAHGLKFEGGRLVVAAGKPVAQLMYTDSEGRVVALCLIATATPAEGVSERRLGDLDMVSWGSAGANYVLVGDAGWPGLAEAARTAALDV